MPDESCRKCGGSLAKCMVCSECRDATSWICTECGTMTKERFHISCFYVVDEVSVEETLCA